MPPTPHTRPLKDTIQGVTNTAGCIDAIRWQNLQRGYEPSYYLDALADYEEILLRFAREANLTLGPVTPVTE